MPIVPSEPILRRHDAWPLYGLPCRPAPRWRRDLLPAMSFAHVRHRGRAVRCLPTIPILELNEQFLMRKCLLSSWHRLCSGVLLVFVLLCEFHFGREDLLPVRRIANFCCWYCKLCVLSSRSYCAGRYHLYLYCCAFEHSDSAHRDHHAIAACRRHAARSDRPAAGSRRSSFSRPVSRRHCWYRDCDSSSARFDRCYCVLLATPCKEKSSWASSGTPRS